MVSSITDTHVNILSVFLYFSDSHEENIGGGGKTIHVVFKYLARSLL
jgi:hypothetical protein